MDYFKKQKDRQVLSRMCSILKIEYGLSDDEVDMAKKQIIDKYTYVGDFDPDE